MDAISLPLPLPTFIPLAGGLGISGFGLTALAGLVLAVVVTNLLLSQRLPDLSEKIQNALWLPLLAGVIGGRLANQLAVRDLVVAQPGTWFRLSGYNLSYTGALVLALTISWWWFGRQGLPWITTWDHLVIPLSLGTAVGWLGVAAVGRITHVPWGMRMAQGVLVQPIQLYALAGFGVLAWLLWRQLDHLDYPGQNLITFVVLASVLRLAISFEVPGSPWLGSLTSVQAGDALLAIVGLIAALRHQRLAAKEAMPS